MTLDINRHNLSIRLAVPGDMPALTTLMNLAIGELLKPFLTPDQVRGSYEIMGLDSQLILDGTYFVVEDGLGAIGGCGGWSRRATLFGGDHSAGRDAALLDPQRDAARVRAMYTHPDFTRRGIGRLVLDACEAAARAEGFTTCDLAATMGGVPLYRACGYKDIEPITAMTSGGVVPLIRMGKRLYRPSPRPIRVIASAAKQPSRLTLTKGDVPLGCFAALAMTRLKGLTPHPSHAPTRVPREGGDPELFAPPDCSWNILVLRRA